jgi:phage host-nuclease inhibitor protein Gam
MLDIMGLSYLQVRKIDRLAREALNLKTIAVDEVGTVKLKYAESEDMPYVDEKNIFHLGRTYRAIKI